MRLLKKNIYWIILAATAIVVAKHMIILHSIFHFEWALATQDAVLSTLLLVISVWGIYLLIRAYPTTAAITVYALFIAGILTTAIVAIQYESLKWWIGEDNRAYAVWLRQTLPVRLLIMLLFNSWMATILALRKNMTTHDARFQQQTDASVLLKEAELFKLRQQLQPHFLYNSLNSISALIMISPDRAQDMIGKLSDFMRSSVRRESDETLPLPEELAYIQSYLDIESVRFGDRLSVSICKEYTDGAVMPPFLLQPILENAIKFGLYGKTGIVNISVRIVLEAPLLTITITNPYDENVRPPGGTGFGLQGIRRRLYLIYARADLLETSTDGENFTTILKIPQQHA